MALFVVASCGEVPAALAVGDAGDCPPCCFVVVLNRGLGGQLDLAVRGGVAEPSTQAPTAIGLEVPRGSPGWTGVSMGPAALPYQDGNRPWVRPVAQAALGEDSDEGQGQTLLNAFFDKLLDDRPQQL